MTCHPTLCRAPRDRLSFPACWAKSHSLPARRPHCRAPAPACPVKLEGAGKDDPLHGYGPFAAAGDDACDTAAGGGGHSAPAAGDAPTAKRRKVAAAVPRDTATGFKCRVRLLLLSVVTFVLLSHPPTTAGDVVRLSGARLRAAGGREHPEEGAPARASVPAAPAELEPHGGRASPALLPALLQVGGSGRIRGARTRRGGPERTHASTAKHAGKGQVWKCGQPRAALVLAGRRGDCW